MKRRNFLKSLAGLPALALFPWSDHKAVASNFLMDSDVRFLRYHEGRMFFGGDPKPVMIRWSRQCDSTDWRVFVGSPE